MHKKVFVFLSILFVYFSYIFFAIEIPFYFDDFPTIVKNPHVKNTENLLSYFTDDSLYTGGKTTVVRRGLVGLSYALNNKIAGLNPAVFRIVNIVFHLLSSFLVLWMFNLFFPGNCFPGLFAMAIFVFLPGTLQPVLYLNSRAESVCVFFSILTFLLYAKSLLDKKLLFLIPAIFSFILASFSKESFLFILPVMFIYGILFHPKKIDRHFLYFLPFALIGISAGFGDPLLKKNLFLTSSYVGLFLIIKLIKKKAGEKAFPLIFLSLVFFASLFYFVLPAGFFLNRSIFDHIYIQTSILPSSILRIFFPYKLSLIHEPHAEKLTFFIGVFVILSFGYILFQFFRKNKIYFFLLGSALFSLLIYFLIVLIIPFNENRLYLPSVFLSVLFAHIFSTLLRQKKSRQFKLFISSIMLIYLLVNIFFGLKYFKILKDPKDYFAYSSKLYPGGMIINLTHINYKLNNLNNPYEVFSDILSLKTRVSDKEKFFYYYKNYLLLFIKISLEVKEFEAAKEKLNELKRLYPESPFADLYTAKYHVLKSNCKLAIHILKRSFKDQLVIEPTTCEESLKAISSIYID